MLFKIPFQENQDQRKQREQETELKIWDIHDFAASGSSCGMLFSLLFNVFGRSLLAE